MNHKLKDVLLKTLGQLKEGKLTFKPNQFHLKTIIIILCITSFSFIIIQHSSRGDGAWNNYGVDCQQIQDALKAARRGENTKEFVLKDITYHGQSHLDWLNNGINFYFEGVFDYKHRPVLNCLEMDDRHLIDVLREEIILPPNMQRGYDVQIVETHNISEIKAQPQAVDLMEMIFKHKKKGFFFEAGAFDCDMNSVTFPIEYNNAWTGVLVEPMPDGFMYCKKVRRKAYLINTCLGTKEQPYFASFDMNGATVHTSNTTGFKTTASFSSEYSRKKVSLDLQCFPVYSILAAVGNPKVDLFVLDIEGFELAVLKTIPWDKVDIEVFDIETDLAGFFQKDSSREKIIEYMDKQGYDRFSHIEDKKDQNDIFIRRDVVKKYNVKQL